MDAKRCDLCGMYFMPDFPVGTLSIQRTGREAKDLCYECSAALDEWWDARKSGTE